jgi:hypothetical protein
MEWEALPGGSLVRDGLDDLSRGRVTAPALLVSLAATRLSSLGVPVVHPLPEADHRLWALLAEDDPDGAHGRMNALLRELVSFERALACAA